MMASSGYIILLLRLRLGVISCLWLENLVLCSLCGFCFVPFPFQLNWQKYFTLNGFLRDTLVLTGIFRSLLGACLLLQYAGLIA